MARHDPQVSFRIPASLKERLDQAAADNNRTITAELVMRLERTFDADHQREAFNKMNPNDLPDEVVENALDLLATLKNIIDKRDL